MKYNFKDHRTTKRPWKHFKNPSDVSIDQMIRFKKDRRCINFFPFKNLLMEFLLTPTVKSSYKSMWTVVSNTAVAKDATAKRKKVATTCWTEQPLDLSVKLCGPLLCHWSQTLCSVGYSKNIQKIFGKSQKIVISGEFLKQYSEWKFLQISNAFIRVILANFHLTATNIL